MKECFSSGSYLYQKHLLYRGTTNNEVTSEQNINSAAAEPHGTQREGNKTPQKLTQRQVNAPIKRSAEENVIPTGPAALYNPTTKSFCTNMCFGRRRNAGKT